MSIISLLAVVFLAGSYWMKTVELWGTCLFTCLQRSSQHDERLTVGFSYMLEKAN